MNIFLRLQRALFFFIDEYGLLGVHDATKPTSRSGRRPLLTLIVNSNCNFTLIILVLWFYFHFFKTKVINVIYLYFDNFTSLLHFFKLKLALLSDATTTYAPLSLVTQCCLDCCGSRQDLLLLLFHHRDMYYESRPLLFLKVFVSTNFNLHSHPLHPPPQIAINFKIMSTVFFLDHAKGLRVYVLR
jgi:hypothetical protein